MLPHRELRVPDYVFSGYTRGPCLRGEWDETTEFNVVPFDSIHHGSYSTFGSALRSLHRFPGSPYDEAFREELEAKRALVEIWREDG